MLWVRHFLWDSIYINGCGMHSSSDLGIHDHEIIHTHYFDSPAIFCKNYHKNWQSSISPSSSNGSHGYHGRILFCRGNLKRNAQPGCCHKLSISSSYHYPFSGYHGRKDTKDPIFRGYSCHSRHHAYLCILILYNNPMVNTIVAFFPKQVNFKN